MAPDGTPNAGGRDAEHAARRTSSCAFADNVAAAAPYLLLATTFEELTSTTKRLRIGDALRRLFLEIFTRSPEARDREVRPYSNPFVCSCIRST